MLTQSNEPPHISVVGDPMRTTNHKIVMKKVIVMRSISTFQEAVTLFLGLMYVLNLKYNATNTIHFPQKALLQLPQKITSKKLPLF